jgi:toxin ParE1/3/4
MKNWPVSWTSRAEINLIDIVDYIAADSPSAGVRVAREIRAKVAALATSPALGRPGRALGTRELVIAGTPYVAIYRAKRNTVQILRVLHSSQRWPRSGQV